MAAWGYDTLDKICIHARPCNILYVFHSIFRKLRLEKFETENRIRRDPLEKNYVNLSTQNHF